jgi:hypothetical protein
MVTDVTIDAHDQCEAYCRMLGHSVPFGYCRRVADGLPCRKILDCWFERFDVTAFVRKHYTPEQIGRFLSPPKPKMASLVELIERAKAARNPTDPSD